MKTVRLDAIKGLSVGDFTAAVSFLRNQGIDPESVDVPVIPNIDAAILAAAEKEPEGFDMNVWHSKCGTSHCRGGWAVVLAGEAGKAIERIFGQPLAAVILYAAAGSLPTPDWYTDDESAIADMRNRAARNQAATNA